MARLQLNKSSLARETAKLSTYERFLPSLDLKRQQLMVERAKARSQLADKKQHLADLTRKVGRDLPMLANMAIDLRDLVALDDHDIGMENVIGTKLPVLEAVRFHRRPYSLLAKPHWVDDLVSMLESAVRLRIEIEIAARRLELLDGAVATITQRVNLFDKVLIPAARANIKKIRVYLNDEAMAAVVRSKIAKRKREAA